MNEANIEQELQRHFDHVYDRLAQRCESRRINTHKAGSQDEVLTIIDSLLDGEEIRKIGFSDSVTLHQLGVYDHIAGYGERFEVINPFERYEDGKLKVFGEQPPGKLDLPYDKYYELVGKYVDKMRETLLSDVLIIGANAITMEGEIVSVDGSGNRVAGMIFGPKKVIVVAGRNKIVKDQAAALDRIHNNAAPLNYIRHIEKHHNRYHDLPCVKTGVCVNCSHPRSACMNTVIVRGAVEYNKDRIHLIIVNQDLGL